MAIEEALENRIRGLIESSGALSSGDDAGQATSDKQVQQCAAWIAAAQNAVHLIFDSPAAAYRARIDKLAEGSHGWVINEAVGKISGMLENLLVDAEAGLLASVADQVRAETFDDFLDHAQSYADADRKNEAGVIAGVVFEDTLRRICRKNKIADKGEKLDDLISDLTKHGHLTGLKAKRARAAVHVRTKATHAQWDEFQLDDVRAAITFSRELIDSKLDG